MSTPNPPDTQTDLSRVLEKIAKIVNASADGDYIYRGEPKSHCKVSSGLYREHSDIVSKHFDIAEVQKEIVKEAKEYDTAQQMNDFEILTELQHRGGKTNLIDFTTDCLVALFFACDREPKVAGRVIFLQKESKNYEVRKPPRTIPRVEAQKSVFVEAKEGFVEPDKVVCIPAALKKDMLDYLQKHHDISTKTIYNDLQGFIENQSSHKIAYTEFYRGLTCQDQATSATDSEGKQELWNQAISHYTGAIELKVDFSAAYNNRGNAYADKGDLDTAIQNYNTAIDLNPELANAYNNRGNAYHAKGDLDTAIQNYNTAIDLNPELANAYSNRGNAYHAKGEIDTAIQNYNTAIDLNPELAEAYYNRGNTYHAKGEIDTAIQNYNTAIDLNPDYANAYYNRGNAYADKGDLDTAIQNYNTAIDLNPELANAYNNRGNAYADKGDLDRYPKL